MELPIYQISLDDIEHGVSKISLVDTPAIEEDFFAFSDVQDTDLYFANEEKQNLIGALLVPDKPIYREHPDLGKFYVVFSADVIEQIALRFNENDYNKNFNVEHGEDISQVVLQENWLVENSEIDKSANYGLKLPKGSWVGVTHVKDKSAFNSIKTNYNGYSVELRSGLELDKLEFSYLKTQKVTPTDAEMLTWLSTRGELESNFSEENGWELVEEVQMVEQDFADISSQPNKKSKYDNENYITRYKYGGPQPIETTRDFCRAMLTNYKGMVFRYEDINQMSFKRANKDFGSYSIWQFKGSYGCRHFWSKRLFKKTKAKSNVKPKNPPEYTNARKKNKDIKLSKLINNKSRLMELKLKFEAVAETTEGLTIYTPTEWVAGAVVYEGADETATISAGGEYQVDTLVLVVDETGVIQEVKEVEASAELEKEKKSDDAGNFASEVAELKARVEKLETALKSAEETDLKKTEETKKPEIKKEDGGEFTKKTDTQVQVKKEFGVLSLFSKKVKEVKGK